MTLVEIMEVAQASLDTDELWGGYIDKPQLGSQHAGHAIELWGWVLGRRLPALAVEVVHDGAMVQRVPVHGCRPDLAVAYPHVPGAERGGFHMTVLVPGMTEVTLLVQAILLDQRRVPLGVVRARRRWREAAAETTALVSVIIPCYKQAQFLADAIESALAQTYQRVEVVVVDDGSTDNAVAVAARYPGVRCIRQDNQGLAAARNTGLRQSNGSYVVFLDADDRLCPEALEVALDSFKAHPESAFVAGHFRYIAADGSPLAEIQPHEIEREHFLALLRRNYIAMHATVMYRREVFETVVGFDTALKACEDYDLYLRIARNCPIYCHNKVVAEYRRHGLNMTGNAALMLKTGVAVLRSQRKYVKENENYHEAYKAGLRSWQENQGERLVSEVLDLAAKHEWKQVLRRMRVLRKYYPYGLEVVLSADSLPRREREALQQRLDDLTAARDAAQQEVAQLQQTIGAQTAQLAALTAQVEQMASCEAKLQAQLVEARDELEYLHLVEYIREVVDASVPPNTTIIVVSRGDESLLQLGGRRAWHFLQAEKGVHAGHHPADSAEAIAQLEVLRARGAEYLLFPSTELWWLEHYPEFKQHLEQKYSVFVRRDDTCLVFTLTERVGQVSFGSLRRVAPISRVFGYDRGRPIDRYYIENFLACHADDIRGRVIEIGDNSYTRMFGDSRVTISDVLHVNEGNPQATFVGDLACADHIPSDSFDCVLLTQTLQLIYDVRAAIKTLYRVLKPGGVLLATFPGISQISQDEWKHYWCWSFTTLSARRLFEEVFPVANIKTEAHGNVLAAIAFLEGLAAEEMCQEDLDHQDPDYEVLITLRASKSKAPHVPKSSESRVRETTESCAAPRYSATQSKNGRQQPSELKTLILLYHRINKLHSDLWSLSVTPDHFSEHLELLRKRAYPLRLQHLNQAIVDGDLPQRSVVVTFDDGYADNFHNAKPLLERYDIPATIFVTTGYIGQAREFWWDELDRLLLQPGTLPEILRLNINASAYQRELGDAMYYSEESWWRHRGWKAWEQAPSLRQKLYHSLWNELLSLPNDNRQRVLDELLTWAGANPVGRPSHRSLSLHELSALADGQLIEVGAHTMTHPALSTLAPAAQRDEIQGSKTYLEELLGRTVTSFAYPHGTPSDYTSQTVALVREAGFTCACSAFDGVVEPFSDRFQLPRISVQDWDGEEFARRLSRWFAL